jgi:flagella basal body P-ring formation protein FlgA
MLLACYLKVGTGSSKCRRLLVAASVAATLARAAEPQPPPLEELVRGAAQRLLPPLTDKERLQVGAIPPWATRCENPVQATRAPGPQVPGRALIELRCEGQAPWHVFVPVKVVGTAPVVIAAHALVFGTVLSANDLIVEQRDVGGLPQGYLDDPAIAVGLTAGRAIAGGAILTNQQLVGAQAVQRGQSVTLVADAGGISVRMAGKALSDGIINQRIKVQNLSSGKIVEGITRSSQEVEIIF